MAPRKAKSSSSKAPAAATRVTSAKHEKPSSAAANKKRKAEAVPPAAATTCAYTYVLIKIDGDGYENNRVSIEGVYPSEDQACAAGIRKFILELEDTEGSEKLELRKIATTKGLSLKQKLKNILSEGELVEGVLEFKVEKTRAFPEENVDEERLLEGLQRERKTWEGDFDICNRGAATFPSGSSEDVYGYLDRML